MFVAPVFLFVIFFIAYVMGGISGDWKSNEASNLPGTGVAGTLDPAKCGNLIPESTYTEKYTEGKKTVTREQLYAAINVLSNERKLPAALIAAKIKQESQFDPNAISPSVGARGISQIMPGTYDGLNGNKSWERAKKLFPNAEQDPFDTYYVMFLGSGYLRTMVDKARVYLNIPEGSQNDDQIYSLAIAAYNAEPNQKDIAAGNIPPYEETQEYVKTIMGENGYYQQFQKCQTIIASGETTNTEIGEVTAAVAKVMAYVKANPAKSDQMRNGTGVRGCSDTIELVMKANFGGGKFDGPSLGMRNGVPRSAPPSTTDLQDARRVLNEGNIPIWHINGNGSGQHWIAIMKISDDNTIHYFDPDGGIIRSKPYTAKSEWGAYFGITPVAPQANERGYVWLAKGK